MLSILRALVTLTCWSSVTWYVFTDGQVFEQSIVHLIGFALGAAPWILMLSKRSTSARRIAAMVIVLLSTTGVVWTAAELPETYREQHRFNAATTPNKPLQQTGMPQ
jgi:hypothetical protein